VSYPTVKKKFENLFISFDTMHERYRFYRVGQKLSDVIGLPVLRITPRATESSTITVSVFLGVVNAVACVGHRPAHILP